MHVAALAEVLTEMLGATLTEALGEVPVAAFIEALIEAFIEVLIEVPIGALIEMLIEVLIEAPIAVLIGVLIAVHVAALAEEFEPWGHDANLNGAERLSTTVSSRDFQELCSGHYRWLAAQGPEARDAKGRTAEEYFTANWPDTESAARTKRAAP